MEKPKKTYTKRNKTKNGQGYQERKKNPGQPGKIINKKKTLKKIGKNN